MLHVAHIKSGTVGMLQRNGSRLTSHFLIYFFAGQIAR